METLGLFAAAGVRVVPIENLYEGAVWVPKHRILMVEMNLTTEEWAWVTRLYLPAALTTPNRPR